ncbi:MAG: tetratricopeptide repeat protein [Lentimicrobiaceae bacterium]|nr:tetratricopeptide repeat protein [Lentimicrobiaceae bacterium]
MHLSFSDYRTAYDYFMKALHLCEKYNLASYKPGIYLNIGVVYYHLHQYDMTKEYYLKALELCSDSAGIALILNNLGANEIVNGNLDSSFYYVTKAYQISKRHNDAFLAGILNNFASYYQNKKQYDSAFYYYHLSLYNSRKNNEIDKEASFLSDIGKLFFEVKKIDSALYYINLSNKIASENNFLKTLSSNYLTLSEIEKSKGRYKESLKFYTTYIQLKDSIYNAEIFGDINQMQRGYEISKTNQQIEELLVDQQIKGHTIRYQKIIQRIIMIALLALVIVLFIIIYQNNKLKAAHKVLFEKNVKLIKLEKKPSEEDKKSANTFNTFDELMDRILTAMEDPAVYCDSSLSVDKLASLTQSNHTYISQAIKNSPYKNYRAFVNSYRIRDAQRFFMEPDAEKYTIEYVSEKVGYKSRSVFYDAFKEITGVSPNYYIKSMKKEQTVEVF